MSEPRCLNTALTGCNGYRGDYDTWICQQPCREPYPGVGIDKGGVRGSGEVPLRPPPPKRRHPAQVSGLVSARRVLSVPTSRED